MEKLIETYNAISKQQQSIADLRFQFALQVLFQLPESIDLIATQSVKATGGAPSATYTKALAIIKAQVKYINDIHLDNYNEKVT